MKSNIFIPKEINVGFQERMDTYTKKLAYIIYYDEKGTLRKETSWNSWRDKDIDNKVYENVPTSGFVLNKKVGDYVSSWNHRQAYVRVYDPRGFEFEIDITNLLYILENTNSIKGKGLEGEFVYGWNGTELVLMPLASPDYVEINKYNKLVQNNLKLKMKDMIIGATYLTKDNEKWVYLGRFDEYGSAIKKDSNGDAIRTEYGGYIYENKNKGKTYWFRSKSHVVSSKSLNKIIAVVSEECVDNYAELFDELERDYSYSPIDESKQEYIRYTKEELEDKLKNSSVFRNSMFIQLYIDGEYVRVEKHLEDGTFSYEIANPHYNINAWRTLSREKSTIKLQFEDIDEFIEKTSPCYKRQYLENGKLYSEDK